MSGGRPRPGVSFDEVAEIALELPGVETGMAYGTPALRVRGRFLARLREDGESVAIRLPLDEREGLLRAEPETFFITDHYAGHPAILLRLSAASREQVADVLERAWRARASKRAIAELDARAKESP